MSKDVTGHKSGAKRGEVDFGRRTTDPSRTGLQVLSAAGFDELIPGTLTAAMADMLVHHAHLSETTSETVRFEQATSDVGDQVVEPSTEIEPDRMCWRSDRRK